MRLLLIALSLAFTGVSFVPRPRIGTKGRKATIDAGKDPSGFTTMIFCPERRVVSGTKIDVTKPISSKEISNSTVKLAFSAFKAEVRNGAVAAADNLEVAKVYIETDY